MVTRDEVIYAFRLLLGRDPESVAVIDTFLPVPNWANLRELFLECAEFKSKLKADAFIDGSTDFINSPPSAVDVEISEEHFERLVKHVQTAWETLGAEKPHWSVLTNPKFLPDNIDANVTGFYDTGESSVQIMENAAARAGKVLPQDLTCFELGCGVGRVTSYLAKRFRHVTASDISHPHLRIASEHLQSKGVENVTLLQLKSLETLNSLEPFDVFYSIIVLQHNPPPLIYRMLHLILDKVRIGGCVYFQVPVAYPDYSFSINDYLGAIERGEGTMEMHVLPQLYLFRLLDEHGFRLLDFQRDNWTGPAFHSVTVFAEKLC
jgi:2-polyprenyl-3-methyl-5-hydroxy-6-metoxy-1,4-benzoquinol methylase